MNEREIVPDRQDYLSKSNCDCLKGILAVCVLLHHLYQQSGLFRHTVIGIGLLFLGSFSVGTFFFLSGYGLLLSFLSSGVAVAAGLLGYKLFGGGLVSEMCVTFSECAFVILVLLTISKVRINNRLTRVLGSISLEIYVMQGMCLSWFHSGHWNIEDPYWYIFAATATTFLLAAAIHPIIKKIFSVCGGNRGGSTKSQINKVSQ